MAFDQAAFNAMYFPGIDPATGQSLATTQAAAAMPTAMPAPTMAAAPAYTGTNYATQLQNTLGGMQNQYASGGAGTHFAFNPAFYLAKNPDVARAVQSGMFTSPLQHWQMFGQNEGRAANAVQNMLHGSAPASMNYGATLNNFGAGRAPPTFGSRRMPNQYMRRQMAGPQSWRNMMGSPFSGMYGGMATMPMLSFLQNSPYASLFGMAPQAQPGMLNVQPSQQGFQIAPGTQTDVGYVNPATVKEDPLQSITKWDAARGKWGNSFGMNRANAILGIPARGWAPQPQGVRPARG